MVRDTTTTIGWTYHNNNYLVIICVSCSAQVFPICRVTRAIQRPHHTQRRFAVFYGCSAGNQIRLVCTHSSSTLYGSTSYRYYQHRWSRPDQLKVQGLPIEYLTALSKRLYPQRQDPRVFRHPILHPAPTLTHTPTSRSVD